MDNQIIQKIEQQSRLEEIDYTRSCLLRECFDSASSEWNNSTLEQKIEALEILVREQKRSVNDLILDMLKYCNQETNKNINTIDIIVTMGKLLEYVIQKRDC